MSSTSCEGRITLPGRGPSTSGVTIQNSKFSGGNSDGIQNGSNGTRIIGNEIYDIQQGDPSVAHSDPIQLYGSQNTVVRGNYIHDTASGIMSGDGTDHEVIEHNVIVRTGNSPIILGPDKSSIVRHNTLDGTLRVCSGGPGVQRQRAQQRHGRQGQRDRHAVDQRHRDLRRGELQPDRARSGAAWSARRTSPASRSSSAAPARPATPARWPPTRRARATPATAPTAASPSAAPPPPPRPRPPTPTPTPRRPPPHARTENIPARAVRTLRAASRSGRPRGVGRDEVRGQRPADPAPGPSRTRAARSSGARRPGARSA